MAIQSVVIGNTDTLVYQAEGDKMISTMIFCNTSNADPYNEDNNIAYLTLHLVRNGAGYVEPPTLPPQETVSDTNMIVNSLAIPASETVFFDTERIVLMRGDQIYAHVASGLETLSCTISTVDI